MQKRPLLCLLCVGAISVAGIIALVPDETTASAEAYENAKLLYSAGNLHAAREAITPALDSKSLGPEAKLLEAEIALGLFDGVAARNALAQAVAKGVPPQQIRHLKAHAFWLEGRYDAALQELEGSDIPAPNRGYAFRIQGRVLMDQGDYSGAQRAFEQALGIAPRDSLIWTDFSRLRLAVGDRRGAIEAVDKALQLNPNQLRAIELRGQLMRSQFGVAAALPWFERGLQISPDDLSLMEQYGLTLGDAGRQRDMLAQARKILAVDPVNPKAFYMQAVLAARAGNFNLASRLLSRIRNDFVERPGPMLLSAIIEYEMGSYNRAVDILQRLIALQPDNVQVRTLLAQAMYRAGDPLDALDVVKPLAIRSDADSYSFMIAARSFEASDQRARSFAPLDEASISTVRLARPLPESMSLISAADDARREPDNARTLLPYIRLLLANGDSDTALDHARRLQANNAGVAEAHMIVGDVLAFRGEHAAAVDAYRLARQISFTEPVMLRLIDGLSRSGNSDAASQTLLEYLSYNPGNITALRMAGYRNLDARQWKNAIYFLQRTVARVGYNDPVLLINLARAHAGAGHKDEAVRLGGIAYRTMPSNAFITASYGRILLESGKRPKAAKELLQKAKSMMPEDTGVSKDLAAAQKAYKKSVQRK